MSAADVQSCFAVVEHFGGGGGLGTRLVPPPQGVVHSLIVPAIQRLSFQTQGMISLIGANFG